MLTNLQQVIKSGIKAVFDYEVADSQLIVSPTKKEFDGEYTFVVFPLVKALKSNPAEIAAKLGDHLKEKAGFILDYNLSLIHI